MIKRFEFKPHRNGKTFEAFWRFVQICKAGKSILFHGPDWVAMDRKSFEKLNEKQDITAIFVTQIEEPKP